MRRRRRWKRGVKEERTEVEWLRKSIYQNN